MSTSSATVEVQCAGCGSSLDLEVSGTGSWLVVTVDACESCTSNAFDEGKAEGIKEAEEE